MNAETREGIQERYTQLQRDYEALQAENAKLRAQNAQLQAEIREPKAVYQENRELRQEIDRLKAGQDDAFKAHIEACRAKRSAEQDRDIYRDLAQGRLDELQNLTQRQREEEKAWGAQVRTLAAQLAAERAAVNALAALVAVRDS